MTSPTTISSSIVSAVKEKAASISATGSYEAIEDGYRVCSALVLKLALESAHEACPDSLTGQFDHLYEILNSLNGLNRNGDKQEIINQITDLLQRLVD